MKSYYFILLYSLVFINPSTSLFSQKSAEISFYIDLSEIEYKGKVGIRGDHSPLSWYETIPLKKISKDYYGISIPFQEREKNLEYKFVIDQGNENIRWENIPNRSEKIVDGLVLNEKWNTAPPIIVKDLPKISTEGIKKDIEILSSALEELHPGILRYNQLGEFKNFTSELGSSITSDITYAEAFLILSKITAQVKCDHTFPSFYNQGSLIKEAIHNQKDKLPFTFKWVNNEMIVFEDATSNSKLVPGTRIISINNTPVQDILKAILPHISTDGNNDQNKISKTEIRGYELIYDAFDVYYPILYPKQQNLLKLEINLPNSKGNTSITTEYVTRESRINILNERNESRPRTINDAWAFRFLEDDIAYLQIGSFATEIYEGSWEKFLNDSFKKIRKKKVKNLIVDIRENTGGQDAPGDYLFQKLVSRPCDINTYIGQKRFSKIPKSQEPFYQSWQIENLELQQAISPDNNGIFELENEFKYSILKPSKKGFNGNVYLMTSSKNVSAAYYFVDKFKRCNVGQIVGEMTGGNQNGINGGTILFMQLPNTKIEIDIPIIGSLRRNPEKYSDMGIVPDVILENKRLDIIHKRDGQLSGLIRLIYSK